MKGVSSQERQLKLSLQPEIACSSSYRCFPHMRAITSALLFYRGESCLLFVLSPVSAVFEIKVTHTCCGAAATSPATSIVCGETTGKNKPCPSRTDYRHRVLVMVTEIYLSGHGSVWRTSDCRPLYNVTLQWGWDVAQSVEHRTGTPPTQVRFPVRKGIFLPESTFSETLLRCPYTPVYNRMHLHLCAH